MKKTILILTGILLAGIALDSCKKGEDDPLLSLKSRKARVTGEWKMTSYKLTETSTTGGITTTEVTTGNGSTYTYSETDPLGTTTSTGIMTLEYTFDKDGTWKSTYNKDGDVDTYTGNWNFTSGVGDGKNKSQITLNTLTYSTTGYSSTNTGNYPDETYDLKELRSKKMVWYIKTSYTSSSNTSSSDEGEIVFEEK